MKRIHFCLLFLILSTSSGICGPLPSYSLDSWEVKKIQLPFDLWIEASESWNLTFTGSQTWFPAEGLLARIPGFGDFSGKETLSVLLDGGLLGGGRHELEVGIELKGAQGILGLSQSKDYWVMPLNTKVASLKRKDGTISSLPNYQWSVVGEDDDILLADKPVVFKEKEEIVAGLTLGGSSASRKNLNFRPAEISLEAGKEGEVALILPGPQPPGELIFKAPSYLLLSSFWSLEGRQLELEHCPERDMWFLSLPPLEQTMNVLQGKLQATLPTAKHVELAAYYGTEKAVLPVFLQKGWFGQDFLTSLEITEEGEARAGIPFLLPDGTIRSTDRRGRLIFTSQTFGPILRVNDPRELIWMGPYTGVRKEIKKTDGPLPNYLVPVFTWNGNFSWRLIGKLEDMFIDTEGSSDIIRGRVGSFQLAGRADMLQLSLAPYEFSKQGWYWSEDHHKRLISWQEKGWGLELGLPKREFEKPYFAFRFLQKGWNIRVSTEDVALSYDAERWRMGGSLNKRLLWVKLKKAGLRLEMDRKEAKLIYRSSRYGKWQLSYKKEQSLYLRGKQGPWEIFLAKENRGWQGGIRLNTVYFCDPWQIALKGAYRVGSNLVLAELGYTLGLNVSDLWSLYLKNTFQYTTSLAAGNKTQDYHYELGVVFRPSSYGMAQIGWAKGEGLVWKLGVALPLIQE